MCRFRTPCCRIWRTISANAGKMPTLSRWQRQRRRPRRATAPTADVSKYGQPDSMASASAVCGATSRSSTRSALSPCQRRCLPRLSLTPDDDHGNRLPVHWVLDPPDTLPHPSDFVDRLFLNEPAGSNVNRHPRLFCAPGPPCPCVCAAAHEKTRIKPSESRMNRSFKDRYWSMPADGVSGGSGVGRRRGCVDGIAGQGGPTACQAHLALLAVTGGLGRTADTARSSGARQLR